MNYYEKVVETIKGSNAPTYIWGAGFWGETLRNCLKKSGIRISGYVVDDNYINMYERDISILPLNQFIKELSAPANLIVAFMGLTEEKEKQISENKNLNLFPLDAPNNWTDGYFDMERYIAENENRFSKIRDYFADEESKVQFDLYLDQKCKLYYRKPYSEHPAYFDSDIIEFQKDETYICCGAYIGNTVLSFYRNLNKSGLSEYKKIYAIESDQENCKNMKVNLSDLTSVEIISKAVSDHTGKLCFTGGGNMISRVSEEGSGDIIDSTTIDEIAKNEDITFITMDIMGSELTALHGACETIKRCKPKIALSAFYKPSHLVELPEFIKKLNPDYKLYFRNYCGQGRYCVLYAV